jgi:glyoxylase-like metal-dependent hydrolase (beta-lactamase superfamily II)
VTAAPNPGHTPGSIFYTLRSHGQQIVFTGDIIHFAAVQGPDPKITVAYDVDPALAVSTRQTALSNFADQRTLLAIPHLSFPGVGHFRRAGTGFEWVPVAYGNRQPGTDAGFADPHRMGDKPE